MNVGSLGAAHQSMAPSMCADRIIKSIQWMWAEVDQVWHDFGDPLFGFGSCRTHARTHARAAYHVPMRVAR